LNETRSLALRLDIAVRAALIIVAQMARGLSDETAENVIQSLQAEVLGDRQKATTV
jgi:hypothetical protein